MSDAKRTSGSILHGKSRLTLQQAKNTRQAEIQHLLQIGLQQIQIHHTHKIGSASCQAIGLDQGFGVEIAAGELLFRLSIQKLTGNLTQEFTSTLLFLDSDEGSVKKFGSTRRLLHPLTGLYTPLNDNMLSLAADQADNIIYANYANPEVSFENNHEYPLVPEAGDCAPASIEEFKSLVRYLKPIKPRLAIFSGLIC
jgi:hypothetical protein